MAQATEEVAEIGRSLSRDHVRHRTAEKQGGAHWPRLQEEVDDGLHWEGAKDACLEPRGAASRFPTCFCFFRLEDGTGLSLFARRFIVICGHTRQNKRYEARGIFPGELIRSSFFRQGIQVTEGFPPLSRTAHGSRACRPTLQCLDVHRSSSVHPVPSESCVSPATHGGSIRNKDASIERLSKDRHIMPENSMDGSHRQNGHRNEVCKWVGCAFRTRSDASHNKR